MPNPQAKLLGGGLGLADAGEFMVQAPNPKDDRKQASSSVPTISHVSLDACGLLVYIHIHKTEAHALVYCLPTRRHDIEHWLAWAWALFLLLGTAGNLFV